MKYETYWQIEKLADSDDYGERWTPTHVRMHSEEEAREAFSVIVGIGGFEKLRLVMIERALLEVVEGAVDRVSVLGPQRATPASVPQINAQSKQASKELGPSPAQTGEKR